MPPLYAWLIAYAAPALLAGSAVKSLQKNGKGPSVRNSVITHATLILSTLISQYFIHAQELVFPWLPNAWSVGIFILAAAASSLVIGRMGALYGLSALIQQLTMLSIAFLLLPAYPIYITALLVAPLFAWCHTMRTEKWLLRTFLFLLWGAASVFLFSVSQNIYLIAAMHTLLGTLLISRSLLYPAD